MTTTKNYKRPNLGAQRLTAKADSKREVAEALGVSPSTAGYWRTGERKPNASDRERLRERYGIPVEAWDEPPTASSTLPPWLQRMAREGLASVDNDPDELERTATLVAETLAETLVQGELAMFEDVLRALRPYA